VNSQVMHLVLCECSITVIFEDIMTIRIPVVVRLILCLDFMKSDDRLSTYNLKIEWRTCHGQHVN